MGHKKWNLASGEFGEADKTLAGERVCMWNYDKLLNHIMIIELEYLSKQHYGRKILEDFHYTHHIMAVRL